MKYGIEKLYDNNGNLRSHLVGENSAKLYAIRRHVTNVEFEFMECAPSRKRVEAEFGSIVKIIEEFFND